MMIGRPTCVKSGDRKAQIRGKELEVGLDQTKEEVTKTYRQGDQQCQFNQDQGERESS